MHYIREMLLVDDTRQEKKEEEDLPALKMAQMHQYNDSRNG